MKGRGRGKGRGKERQDIKFAIIPEFLCCRLTLLKSRLKKAIVLSGIKYI